MNSSILNQIMSALHSLVTTISKSPTLSTTPTHLSSSNLIYVTTTAQATTTTPRLVITPKISTNVSSFFSSDLTQLINFWFFLIILAIMVFEKLFRCVFYCKKRYKHRFIAANENTAQDTIIQRV